MESWNIVLWVSFPSSKEINGLGRSGTQSELLSSRREGEGDPEIISGVADSPPPTNLWRTSPAPPQIPQVHLTPWRDPYTRPLRAFPITGSYFPEALPIPGRLQPQHHHPPRPRPSCHLRRAVGGRTLRPTPRALPLCLVQPMALLARAGPPFLKGQEASILFFFFFHSFSRDVEPTEGNLLLPSARFLTGLASFLSTARITWLIISSWTVGRPTWDKLPTNNQKLCMCNQ